MSIEIFPVPVIALNAATGMVIYRKHISGTHPEGPLLPSLVTVTVRPILQQVLTETGGELKVCFV